MLTHNDCTVLTELPVNSTEEQISKFLKEEVRNAINKMKKNNTPGRGRITTKVLQGEREKAVKATHTPCYKDSTRRKYQKTWDN